MYKYVYAIHNYSEQLQKHDFPGHWDIKRQDRLLGRRRTSDHNAAVSGNTKLSILRLPCFEFLQQNQPKHSWTLRRPVKQGEHDKYWCSFTKSQVFDNLHNLMVSIRGIPWMSCAKRQSASQSWSFLEPLTSSVELQLESVTMSETNKGSLNNSWPFLMNCKNLSYRCASKIPKSYLFRFFGLQSTDQFLATERFLEHSIRGCRISRRSAHRADKLTGLSTSTL